MLEKPLGLVTRLTDYLNSMWVFRPGFTLYSLISYFMITGIWVFFLMWIPQMTGLNPITAFYINASGHWLSWLALVAVITAFGYFNLIKGLYVAAFIYSIHELVWLFFDGLALNQMMPLFVHFWPLVAVLGFLGLGYFVAYRSLPTWKEIAIVASIVAFDLVWYSFDGWKVAVQNFNTTPKTIYFNDPAVNLIEVLSWVLPAVIVLLPSPKTVRGWALNMILLIAIDTALEFGVLGISAYAGPAWGEVGNPAGALIIAYGLVMIWPLYKANHPSISFEGPLDMETSPKALYTTSKLAIVESWKQWVMQKWGRQKQQSHDLEDLAKEVKEPEWCNLP